MFVGEVSERVLSPSLHRVGAPVVTKTHIAEI